jgi:hypothetical protein
MILFSEYDVVLVLVEMELLRSKHKQISTMITLCLGLKIVIPQTVFVVCQSKFLLNMFLIV